MSSSKIANEKALGNAVERCREKGVILPKFQEMRDPATAPDRVKDGLRNVGLWDRNSLNLFRITWKNEPIAAGGEFGGVNFLELPSSLTGVRARIVMLLGKWFPTGAHKVGAAYGCLAPRIIKGQFDPINQKAVWPSTGNYCRGGAFDSFLMGCDSVAILPQEMSRERFEWLKDIGAEVIATPGCESNVKEIYDKCWEIRKTRPDCVIFNQFEEFGNSVWHYNVTGHAIREVFDQLKGAGSNLAAFISATGSAGTIAAGDFLRTVHPFVKVVATEALQCPTLLANGFGAHRIEGIGDKHVPWIHNLKNTDMVIAIDDEHCMRLVRLFNEPEGRALLKAEGLDAEIVDRLDSLGISGASNLLGAIKTAKYFEMTERDIVFSVATDSMELYQSRLQELRDQLGDYSEREAFKDRERYLLGASTDNMLELTYESRKRIHNLKYFTWVEQQGRDSEELNQLWYDPDFWPGVFAQAEEWDQLIDDFNDRTGLLK